MAVSKWAACGEIQAMAEMGGAKDRPKNPEIQFKILRTYLALLPGPIIFGSSRARVLGDARVGTYPTQERVSHSPARASASWATFQPLRRPPPRKTVSLRAKMPPASGFSDWLENQKAAQDAEDSAPKDNVSYFGHLYLAQENLTNQLQGLSGSLPEAGPLSASFRNRVTNAVYLLAASGVFALLTVFVGLPTLLIRPTKFVLCMTISTLLAASSVIVMQKPSVFCSNLLTGGVSSSAPVVLLLCSVLFTLYVSIFVHTYLSVVFAGGVQLTCLLYYLASFVPGGSAGLKILLQTTATIVWTALQPMLYVCKKGAIACLSRMFS
jgi:hypothetical protein